MLVVVVAFAFVGTAVAVAADAAAAGGAVVDCCLTRYSRKFLRSLLYFVAVSERFFESGGELFLFIFFFSGKWVDSFCSKTVSVK